ncbi:MAG: Na(+)/H(+) antiporter subunit B [Verrucomicrobia bacterium]|nr:Na(+)/H(+) antiporter subunit B [Verrucomicrobiota bacterium]
MKGLALFAVVLTGALLLYATGDFPAWGSVHSPANGGELSSHYIENVRTETKVPNIVTAVLADYRSYDTMFETVVVFVAGIAIIALLRDFGNGSRGYPPALANNLPEEPDLIITQTCNLVIPVLQIFALYVLAHGHYSPGGGFQGGVMLGASYILIALANGVEVAMKAMSERKIMLLAATGILIYSGTGLICLLLGENFLDYHVLSRILPTDPIMARSHAILIVETGVAVTVAAIMFSIYANLATRGTLKGGL